MIYTVTNAQERIEFSPENDVERVLQNVKNLLRCKMGEVPFDRMRGFNPTVMDKPGTEINAAVLREIDRTLMWEPRAKMVKAETEIGEDGHTLIKLTVDVDLNQ